MYLQRRVKTTYTLFFSFVVFLCITNTKNCLNDGFELLLYELLLYVRKSRFLLKITHKRTEFVQVRKAMLVLTFRAAKKCCEVLIVLKW